MWMCANGCLDTHLVSIDKDIAFDLSKQLILLS